jgi:hypothetical protein
MPADPLAVLVLLGLTLAVGCRPASNPPSAGSKAAVAPPVVQNRTQNFGREAAFSFRTIGAESGLDFERYDDIRGQRRILEANGGGVALFDYDCDGLLDVLFTNGCRLPLSLGDRGTRCEIFRNSGGMRFGKVTGSSLLVQHGYTQGCAIGDYDADGFDDFYVTAYGPDGLWRNNGDGTFGDVTAAAGITAPQWGSSAAFGDVDLDGDLDLYVANYLDESDESPKLCPNPRSPEGYEQCPPAVFSGVDDLLFLSDSEGRFADATALAGIAGTKGKGLGVLIADLGGDPRPEIFVANDGEANFLFVAADTNGGATPPVRYKERGLTSGVALNEAGYAQANMGVAAGDYDADGDTDVFITHFFGDTNTLYQNRGGLAFEDATRSSRLGVMSRGRLGWGTVFFDPDNDGRLDLIVANGHVDDRTFMLHEEPYRMRPQVFRNGRDGSYRDVSESAGDYFGQEWLGRGVAVGDLDRDGRIDAAVSHQLAPSIALRNETRTDNGSLTLRFVGTRSNRSGYGARVELVGADPILVRDLPGGGSFQSALAPEIHLGIGTAGQAAIRVYWPSGRDETHAGLSPGRWSLVESHGIRRLP